MPVHRHKKDTTPDTLGSTQEQTTPALPEQQTFQQYLRELARAALRVVLEGVMREELDALIGVGWGQNSSKRKGYRNGSYTRDLVTSSGRIEEIKVPRECEAADRSDRCLHDRDQLPHHRLGNSPGYPLAQNLGGMKLEN